MPRKRKTFFCTNCEEELTIEFLAGPPHCPHTFVHCTDCCIDAQEEADAHEDLAEEDDDDENCGNEGAYMEEEEIEDEEDEVFDER